MITKNAMQLKSIIKAKAKETNLTPQATLQIYVLERFLLRIADSVYKDYFILKGGVLITSLIGINARATMDMDTTVQGLSLDYENMEFVFKNICSVVNTQDYFSFVYNRIEDIRENDEYPGIRVFLYAKYEKMNVPFTIDVTTGDIITPAAIKYSYPLIFDEGKIEVFSYNIETVLAEKLEAIFSRGIESTRLRDYYDVYILNKIYCKKINWTLLYKALAATSKKRGSYEFIDKYKEILNVIKMNDAMNDKWNAYQHVTSYACEIEFTQCLDSISEIMNKLEIT